MPIDGFVLVANTAGTRCCNGQPVASATENVGEDATKRRAKGSLEERDSGLIITFKQPKPLGRLPQRIEKTELACAGRQSQSVHFLLYSCRDIGIAIKRSTTCRGPTQLLSSFLPAMMFFLPLSMAHHPSVCYMRAPEDHPRLLLRRLFVACRYFLAGQQPCTIYMKPRFRTTGGGWQGLMTNNTATSMALCRWGYPGSDLLFSFKSLILHIHLDIHLVVLLSCSLLVILTPWFNRQPCAHY